jgi:hypothetical protein
MQSWQLNELSQAICLIAYRDTFIDMCKKILARILGPNAFKDQETAMDEGMKLPDDKKLCDAIEQYTTINMNMQLFGENSKSFKMRELKKQVKKMMTPRIRLEYIKLGGDTFNNKKAILVANDKLDTYAKMNREIAELDQKQRNNNENTNEKSN